MNTKLKVFYLTTFIFVLFILSIITYVLSHGTSPKPPTLPTPTHMLSNQVSPTLPPQESIDDVVKRIQTKKSLNASDQSEHNSLISQADHNGTINHTNMYHLYYVASSDVFRVQIMTWNVTPAINAAIDWLRSQGMSNQGICNLPLVIYRDPKQFDATLTAGMEFYPIPINCQ